MNRKSSVALLSVGSNSLLILTKFIVGFISGSVSIISEAIHSMMDLLAAMIAFFAVRFAEVPPDEDHPYGHEKIENVSGVIEAVLILVASGLIIFKSTEKIIEGSPIESVGLGFWVMMFSATVNILVSRKLYQVAKEEDSIALEADALHLKADVYTSLGVAAGLGIIWLTGFSFLDPILAIGIALFILKEAVEMLRSAFSPLIDSKLSDSELETIRKVMAKFNARFIDYHELRTRKSGKTRHIDLHLTVSGDAKVRESHHLCDEIEDRLEKELRNTRVLIHIEPEA